MGRSRREGAAPLSQERMGQMPPCALSLVAPRGGKQPLCFQTTGVSAMGHASLCDGGKLM